jgi:toxin FitB
MILLDTNVVSELARPAPDPSVLVWFENVSNDNLFISSITVAEIEFGIELMPPGRRRTDLAALIGDILAVFSGRLLPFDGPAAHSYARIAAKARKAGQVIPTLDGYIAAIALSLGLAVATRDEMPFRAAGLTVINPWTA